MLTFVEVVKVDFLELVEAILDVLEVVEVATTLELVQVYTPCPFSHG